MTQKNYDLVLFGATGFTGGLVAEYLARRRAPGLRWALAGRDPAKLSAARARLAAIDPTLAKLPLFTADSSDPGTLRILCEQSRVICTTVGPYARHGRALVAACAASGSDYCDLTGEVPFVRDMIDQHHDTARRSGARIVHCCGFDSIPSDLGVFMLHQAAQARGAELASVRLFFGESSGGVSGGTVASMLDMMEEAAGDRDMRRLLRDPYALNPKEDRAPGAALPDAADQLGLRFDPDLGRWTGPFFMATVNTRVVRRSNALLHHAYGRGFRYHEAMSFAQGPKGLIQGAAMVAGLGVAVAVMQTPLRRLIAPWLPQPGDGPSEEKRRNGFFRARLIGELAGGAGTLHGLIEGHGDPGYQETARMLGESALCLAQDPRDVGADPQDQGGGVLTPASAMGANLLPRLRQAGMTFSIVPTLP